MYIRERVSERFEEVLKSSQLKQEAMPNKNLFGQKSSKLDLQNSYVFLAGITILCLHIVDHLVGGLCPG